MSFTYDHRLVRTGHHVRSAILKHQIGRSVVEWVTISESLLLYVFCILAFGGRSCRVLVEWLDDNGASNTNTGLTSIVKVECH